MNQLIGALAYLHENKNIVHRDIKPANLLVNKYDRESNKMEIKLTDFGFAAFKSDKDFIDPVGTPLYKAPELLIKGARHSNMVDIWAVGVMTFELLSGGEFPFNYSDENDQNEDELRQKILDEEPNWELFPTNFVSKECR